MHVHASRVDGGGQAEAGRGKPRPYGRGAWRSEVAAEFAEGWQDDEFTGSRDDDLMLQLPGVLVRNVDRVQTNLHRGVDVASVGRSPGTRESVSKASDEEGPRRNSGAALFLSGLGNEVRPGAGALSAENAGYPMRILSHPGCTPLVEYCCQPGGADFWEFGPDTSGGIPKPPLSS